MGVVDNLHGSYLRHRTVKTLKKVLPKSPTFPTPADETCSIFKGFRVKDRVWDTGVGCSKSYTPCPFIRLLPRFRAGMRGMAFVQNAQEKAKNVGYNCINPTPHTKILHPILHPKSSVNTGHLAPWCRKCRRISKTFFVEGGRKNAMQRSGKCKTSDFFGQKYGCFAPKLQMFSSKKSDDFVFRKESRASLLQAMPGKR